MSKKENVIPEVRQIRSALGKMKKDDEFILTIPIPIIPDSRDEDRTKEKEKTDRLSKENRRKEGQNGREEV